MRPNSDQQIGPIRVWFIRNDSRAFPEANHNVQPSPGAMCSSEVHWTVGCTTTTHLADEQHCYLPILQAVHTDITNICIQLEGSPAIDCVDDCVYHLHRTSEAVTAYIQTHNLPVDCGMNMV